MNKPAREFESFVASLAGSTRGVDAAVAGADYNLRKAHELLATEGMACYNSQEDPDEFWTGQARVASAEIKNLKQLAKRIETGEE
ncbi:hypothetical protein K3148_09450 [Qipengyuania aurantiaca]|uniref:Uncharacterized protein n=1 Tax=Qipengyuania aurantiaca TaxID=2867233 RepID=A0ABX8ZNC2_9SPHN|nr:hypothetical protein [Qipengyuania aurantiaca]QZD89062.1 hypothetical protein K3148_09450 [Qipengyuania aurantiaca]